MNLWPFNKKIEPMVSPTGALAGIRVPAGSMPTVEFLQVQAPRFVLGTPCDICGKRHTSQGAFKRCSRSHVKTMFGLVDGPIE